MRTLAIIPARGGSKRLPGKNVRPFCGKPLIHWSIEFARSVAHFTSVEVSTDSAEIAEQCAFAGQPVSRLRPSELATDEASSVDVVLDLLDWKASQGEHFDLVALLQPTTPVRNVEHWNTAYELIEAGNCEAVLGVGPARSHPHLTFKMGLGQHLSHWITERPPSLRAQDLEPAVVVNGSLYLVKTQSLQTERTFTPAKTSAVLMVAEVENLDIDTEFDWIVAEKAVEHFINLT